METTFEGGNCLLKLCKCYFSQVYFNTTVKKIPFYVLGKAAYHGRRNKKFGARNTWF